VHWITESILVQNRGIHLENTKKRHRYEFRSISKARDFILGSNEMTSTLLQNELTNLVSEAKRKNPDLRNAAEKSLQELKALPTTSEQQLAAGRCRDPSSNAQ
jgi:hypothetical protein